MANLFASAAALLRGRQPEGAIDGSAGELLDALGYGRAAGSPIAGTRGDVETEHRARLLEATAQFSRFFELGAPEAPGLFCFGAEVDPASIDPIHRRSPMLGVSGVGLTMQEAFQRCAGEGIEYLSALQSGDDRLLRSGSTGGIPTRLPDFVAARADGSDRELSWFPVRRLCDNAEFLLPADLCLRRPQDKRDFIPPFPLSIGSAAGTSFEGAVLHGLLELIERDAASLWWRGGRRGCALDTGEAGMEALLQRLRPAAFSQRRSWLLDITTDIGVPSVVAISCGADGLGFAFGLATRPTLEAATRSATLEMCQLELAYAVIEAKRRERGESGLNPKDRIHLERASKINADRCLLLQPVGRRGEHMVIDNPEPAGAVALVAGRLESLGIESFCVDLTRPRFAVPVARVIAPGLQIEPSEIMTPRLADTIMETGGGTVFTGGVALL
jgi:ribosomal protein S12 methylthiotransferase accessory factor